MVYGRRLRRRRRTLSAEHRSRFLLEFAEKNGLTEARTQSTVCPEFGQSVYWGLTKQNMTLCSDKDRVMSLREDVEVI